MTMQHASLPCTKQKPAEDIGRLLRAGFLAVAGLWLLASCAYVPVAVEGLPVRPDPAAQSSDNSWIFVPVGAWITRETVRPVSLGMCGGAGCPGQISVAVVDLTGEDARRAERSLSQPAGLARELEAGNRRRIALVRAAQRNVPARIAQGRIPPEVAASVQRFVHGRFQGFRLTMRRADGSRLSHAAALSRRRAGALRVVLVIGPNAEQVETAAKMAAQANL